MYNVMESKSITNKLLLDLIVMIQDYKRWKISEGVFNDNFRKKSDWYEETKRYYSSIPSEYLAKLGLKKNIQDFEKSAKLSSHLRNAQRDGGRIRANGDYHLKEVKGLPMTIQEKKEMVAIITGIPFTVIERLTDDEVEKIYKERIKPRLTNKNKRSFKVLKMTKEGNGKS